MKELYIDLRYAFSVSSKSGKFNGGNNYSKHITSYMISNCNREYRIIILCNYGLKKILQQEFVNGNYTIMEISNLSNVNTINLDEIYYCPLISDSINYAKELSDFLQTHVNCKICVSIHDRRHHENWFDRYDGILKKGIKSNWIILGIGRMLNSIRKDKAVRKVCNLADEVITVSNYSMQEIIKLSNPKSISYYTQEIDISEQEKNTENDGYILFVSAGRPEKNFIRTLIAFKDLVKEYPKLKMIVTGISKEQLNNILGKRIVTQSFMDSYIEAKDYVESYELDELYRNCRFVIFPSKTEGYGLPAAEAIAYGKPVVCSNRTSIPEAAGAVAIYIDPYSIDSIKFGMAKMMDSCNYDYLSKKCEDYRKIMNLKFEIDREMMLFRILN